MKTQLIINSAAATSLMELIEYHANDHDFGGEIYSGSYGKTTSDEGYRISEDTRWALKLMEEFGVRDSHIVDGWMTSRGNLCVIIDTGKETQLLISSRRHALHHSGLRILTEHPDHREWVCVENRSESDAPWWECGVEARLD